MYKSGFATTQSAYEDAIGRLFSSLDRVEEILSKQRYTTFSNYCIKILFISRYYDRYLTGDSLTEADIRLFTTLVRFDAVYVGHFKVL